MPPWIAALALLAIVVMVYSPVRHAGFIWDDAEHLTENPCIIGPLGLAEIWTTKAARICPLVLTTFWAEHKLWGLHPLPYHLVNVLLHAASTLMLWRLLLRLDVPGAWLGAALWSLHPMQVESVAWITELKNTQSGLFYLLTIFFFTKWKASNQSAEIQMDKWSYPLALLFGFMAMASKSSTVILPLVLGLCAWWMTRRWDWRDAIRLAPFCAMSVLAGALSMWTQKLEGAHDPQWSRSMAERIAVAGQVVWFYLGKLVWPQPLIFIYPRWNIDAYQLLSYLPTLAAAMLFVFLWLKRKSGLRPVFMAYAYFLIALLPVLGLLDHYFLRYSFVGDHFQYLASIGPLALVAACIICMKDRLWEGAHWARKVFTASLITLFGILSFQRMPVFHDTDALWVDTLQKNPDCWMAHNNRGVAFLDSGKVDEAIGEYSKAMNLLPNYAEIHNNMGNALTRKGLLNEAMSELHRALELKADYADAYNNLGATLFAAGRVDEAVALYRKTLRLKPYYTDAYNNLGNAFIRKGMADEAIANFNKALALSPKVSTVHFNFGSALQQLGRDKEAVIEYERALAISPNFTDAHVNLAVAFSEMGKLDQAISHYQTALQINPQFVIALNNLARIFATCPDPMIRNGQKALELAVQANRLSGGVHPLVLGTLAAAEAECGHFDEAVSIGQKAHQFALASKLGSLAAGIESQVELYKARQPFHEKPVSQ